jgi:hypothetical protein
MPRRNPAQGDLMSPITQDAASAEFSPCRRYRYTLSRTWNPDKPRLALVLLNPSDADETHNDPTVARCQRRAVRMGFGGVDVVNLFGLCSTQPDLLYSVDDPVGPENDAAIERICQAAGLVIVAWGAHGQHQGRASSVQDKLRSLGIALHALAINGDGSPKHPLYVANDIEPIPYV